MEWNFLFRIDHLNEQGEERNLKGLVYTDDGALPSLEQIKQFLKDCGYNVDIKDPEQLIFFDPNPNDPIEIRIVQLGSKEKEHVDMDLRMLVEHFIKKDPIGL